MPQRYLFLERRNIRRRRIRTAFDVLMTILAGIWLGWLAAQGI
jgi:hypothetical protein